MLFVEELSLLKINCPFEEHHRQMKLKVPRLVMSILSIKYVTVNGDRNILYVSVCGLPMKMVKS